MFLEFSVVPIAPILSCYSHRTPQSHFGEKEERVIRGPHGTLLSFIQQEEPT